MVSRQRQSTMDWDFATNCFMTCFSCKKMVNWMLNLTDTFQCNLKIILELWGQHSWIPCLWSPYIAPSSTILIKKNQIPQTQKSKANFKIFQKSIVKDKQQQHSKQWHTTEISKSVLSVLLAKSIYTYYLAQQNYKRNPLDKSYPLPEPSRTRIDEQVKYG